MAAAAFAAQDAIKFVRTYKEGDKDSYKLSMQMSMQGGSADMTMKMTSLVKKVYENGDADIESSVSDMKITFNGQTMSPPAQPPTTTKVNKSGMPVAGSTARGRGMSGDFLRYATFLGEKGIKVGETIDIDQAETADSKTRIKGTLKLESLEEGVAKLIGKFDIWTPEAGDKPMKVASTSWVDVSTAKPNKVEGTISNVSAGPGMELDAIQFTMERLK